MGTISRESLGYTLYLRVTDENNQCLYMVEHAFPELPEPDAVIGLFEAAKGMFGLLYPEAEAFDFSVEARLARTADATLKG